MARVKRGRTRIKRRKNILQKTKGYLWRRKNLIKLAKTAVVKAGAYAYRDRRAKKRTARALWNIKINAGLEDSSINYSTLIGGLKKKGIVLNRKMLSELAQNHNEIFQKVIKSV